MLVDIIAPSLTQAKTVGEGHTMNLRHVLLELTDTIFLLLIMCVNVSFSKNHETYQSLLYKNRPGKNWRQGKRRLSAFCIEN